MSDSMACVALRVMNSSVCTRAQPAKSHLLSPFVSCEHSSLLWHLECFTRADPRFIIVIDVLIVVLVLFCHDAGGMVLGRACVDKVIVLFTRRLGSTLAIARHVCAVLLHINGDDLLPPMYSTNRPAPSWWSPPQLTHAKRSSAVSSSRSSQELHLSSLRIPRSSGMSTLSAVDNPRSVILSHCTRRAVRRRDGSLVISVLALRETLDDPTAYAVPAVCNLKCSPQHPSPMPVCQARIGQHTDANHVGTTIHSARDGRSRGREEEEYVKKLSMSCTGISS